MLNINTANKRLNVIGIALICGLTAVSCTKKDDNKNNEAEVESTTHQTEEVTADQISTVEPSQSESTLTDESPNQDDTGGVIEPLEQPTNEANTNLAKPNNSNSIAKPQPKPQPLPKPAEPTRSIEQPKVEPALAADPALAVEAPKVDDTTNLAPENLQVPTDEDTMMEITVEEGTYD